MNDHELDPFFRKSFEQIRDSGVNDALRFLICRNLIFKIQEWDVQKKEYDKEYLRFFVNMTKDIFTDDEIRNFFNDSTNFSSFFVADEIKYIVDYIMTLFKSGKESLPFSDPVEDAKMILRLEFCRELFCTDKWHSALKINGTRDP